MRWSISAVFLLLAIAIGFSQNRQGKDYALFFANSDYSTNTDFDNLRNPIRDAWAVADELKEMYGFETKVYENYTRTQIYRVLEQWQGRRFGSDDQFFLFFSGHGTFWEFTKKGYFVPKTDNTDYSAYIELTDLGNIVTQIPCRHILLAVDACYSGTIDQEIAFKGRSFSRPNESIASDRNNLIYRQLRNQSRLLITSGGKQRTPDGNDHSPFSKAILDGLRAAYTFGDGLLTFTDLLGQLERVSPVPHQGELPDHNQGGFVFASTDQAIEINLPSKNIIQKKTFLSPPDDLIFVEGGDFKMGSRKGFSDEEPIHQVTLSDFYIGRYEVTFDEYDAFCKATNRKLPDDEGWGRGKRPVINIRWEDAVWYCNWLSEQNNFQKVYTIVGGSLQVDWSANGYRLLTEAEWEFAARSQGRQDKWAGTSYENDLIEYVNGKGEEDGYKNTSPVGSFRPNSLGLYDMTGNVFEWCWDWYDEMFYKSSPSKNPTGPNWGLYRVIRGGSWFYGPSSLRCSDRFLINPGSLSHDIGFRIARTAL